MATSVIVSTIKIKLKKREERKGEKERKKKAVFEVSSLANWQAGDTISQNKEVSRTWGKCLVAF